MEAAAVRGQMNAVLDLTWARYNRETLRTESIQIISFNRARKD